MSAVNVSEREAEEPSAQTAHSEFRERLSRLGETQTSLARRLSNLGDRRNFLATLRSVQRMANGEARVSGEMIAILQLMERDQNRARRLASEVAWERQRDGTLVSFVQDFRLTITPQSKGRWQIYAVHLPTQYSPEMPHWRDSLEAAKIRAVQCVDEGLDKMDRFQDL